MSSIGSQAGRPLFADMTTMQNDKGYDSSPSCPGTFLESVDISHVTGAFLVGKVARERSEKLDRYKESRMKFLSFHQL